MILFGPNVDLLLDYRLIVGLSVLVRGVYTVFGLRVVFKED